MLEEGNISNMQGRAGQGRAGGTRMANDWSKGLRSNKGPWPVTFIVILLNGILTTVGNNGMA